jgi:hypothetical protein
MTFCKTVVSVLGHFPQLVSPFMNWRALLIDDSLQVSLQISERL